MFFVKKMGRHWTELAINCKKYFQNRNFQDLKEKYYSLERNKKNLDVLKKKAESLKGVENEIVKNYKKGITKWSHDETLYLVLGVQKYGKRWGDILQKYKQHFNDNRNRYDLSTKYNFLQTKTNEFKYFQEQAVLLDKNQPKMSNE